MIQTLSTGQFSLRSSKGRNLGTYDSMDGAQKRERQVNFFKNKDKFESDHPGRTFPPKRRSVAGYKKGD